MYTLGISNPDKLSKMSKRRKKMLFNDTSFHEQQKLNLHNSLHYFIYEKRRKELNSKIKKSF